jgi:hypothetical protein
MNYRTSLLALCSPADFFRSLGVAVKSLFIGIEVNSSRFAVHRFVFPNDKFIQKMAFNIDLM